MYQEFEQIIMVVLLKRKANFWEKIVTSNTRISNLENGNSETVISNLISKMGISKKVTQNRCVLLGTWVRNLSW